MRAFWAAAGCALVFVVVAGVLFLGRGSAPSSSAVPRARVYSNTDLCLLTDGSGLSSPAASSVWSGMQAASVATHAKVSYLAVTGPDTADNAAPYVNTLIARRCDLVLAVGPAEVGAVAARAGAEPATRFVVVADGVGASNVAVIPADPVNRVAPSVTALLDRAVRGDFVGGPFHVPGS